MTAGIATVRNQRRSRLLIGCFASRNNEFVCVPILPGQVIGVTDRIAGEAISRPVTFGEVYATLFHHLEINVDQTTITDHNGRPQYLVEDDGKILRELI